VIIGAAIGKVVSGIVEDVLMPTIGLVLPGGDWRKRAAHPLGQNAIKYGDLAGRILDFFIVALVVFALTKLVLEKPAPAATTKSCPECLEAIRSPPGSAAPADRRWPEAAMGDLILTFTGRDAPGITARISRALAQANARLSDVEQVVVQGLLTLGFAVEAQDETALLKELLFVARELGLALDYRKPEKPRAEAPPRYALTLIGPHAGSRGAADGVGDPGRARSEHRADRPAVGRRPSPPWSSPSRCPARTLRSSARSCRRRTGRLRLRAPARDAAPAQQAPDRDGHGLHLDPHRGDRRAWRGRTASARRWRRSHGARCQGYGLAAGACASGWRS